MPIVRFDEIGIPSGHRDLLVWRISSYLPRNVRGVKPDLLLARIQRGDITNLNYDDLERLAQERGFGKSAVGIVTGSSPTRICPNSSISRSGVGRTSATAQAGGGPARRYGLSLEER